MTYRPLSIHHVCMDTYETYVGICRGWGCDEIVIGRLACPEHHDEVAYEFVAPVGNG